MSTMLLDSASLYFRAFYGVPDTLRTPDGRPNNAIRGFLEMIARLVDTYHPTGFVGCLDYDWRPQFRVDAIDTYKTHRVAVLETNAEETPDDLEPQVPVIIELLAAFGLSAVGAAGFEADDVIGTLAKTIPGPIDVVTGDRDLFQVIDDQKAVRILYTARGLSNMQLMDNAALFERYGVYADQYADFAALRGDPSDGLPGVKGIGEKSAATLLAEFGTLAALREAARNAPRAPLKPAQVANINASASYLDAAPLVVRVREDVPVSDLDPAIPRAPRDPAALELIAHEWGVGSSIARLTDALASN